VAFFGASTGAAGALLAAAELGAGAAAVVSRGGRPDLAGDALPRVTAPTLLIVGGDDVEVLTLNREAEARMRCERRLEVIPGATHLFEEPGALERVADLAADWLAPHLREAGRGHRVRPSTLL
jgi:putative phosphoribosyl transferase